MFALQKRTVLLQLLALLNEDLPILKAIEMEREEREKINPLPAKIGALRQSSFSLFVSNLPEDISKPELKAMFWRAGRIVDFFIPVDRASGKKRGIAFVRFLFEVEARRVVEIVTRRSFRGRKISAQVAHYQEQLLRHVL